MFDKDAFSNGQVDSKLWLCQELESIGWQSKLTRVYGGWHGMLGFLLLSRQNFRVDRIESYDLDPSCERMADMVNENWVIKDWQFKAYTGDCNQILPGKPDLIINTSTEHFDTMDWFNNIPKGTRVILQGNNMPHDDHIIHSTSINDFVNRYPLTDIMYQGELRFVYPEWKFTRYMTIGVK